MRIMIPRTTSDGPPIAINEAATMASMQERIILKTPLITMMIPVTFSKTLPFSAIMNSSCN